MSPSLVIFAASAWTSAQVCGAEVMPACVNSFLL